MDKSMDIISALNDPALLGGAVRKLDSFRPWLALFKGLYALPMTDEDFRLYRECTGRKEPPQGPMKEGWFVIGRRGRKTFCAALIAVYEACFRSYEDVLAQGERGIIPCIAVDRRQAGILFRYIEGILDSSPILSAMITRRSSDSIELSNQITIEVYAGNFRSIRGRTIITAMIDEIAYLPTDESARPDSELITAIRPGMITVPNAKLLAFSSPYARKGELWRHVKDYHGKTGDKLVWCASSQTMNPLLPNSVIVDAYASDPVSAASEYGAEFRSDVSGFIDADKLDSLIIPGRKTLPPTPGISYVAFTDPSGGWADSFTLCVSHLEGSRVVIDCLMESRPPFSPESVVREYADTLRQYGVNQVFGDRYSGQWVVESFSKCGINYCHSPLSASELYLHLLPILNSGQIELLDDRRSFGQLAGLERKVSGGGRELISHGPGQHDDLANSLAGAAWCAKQSGAVASNDGELVFYFQRTEPQQGMVRREDDLTDLGSVAYTTRPRNNFNF